MTTRRTRSMARWARMALAALLVTAGHAQAQQAVPIRVGWQPTTTVEAQIAHVLQRTDILERNGLLKHHTVGTPFAKEDYTRGVAGWTHWTGVLKENGSGQRFAVDSWIYENGENPAIVEAEFWYVDSLAELPKSTR